MAVSGHKSLQSLAIYEKVNENEKLMMGMCLNYSLLKPQEVLNIIGSQEKQKELPAPQEKMPSLPVPEPT